MLKQDIYTLHMLKKLYDSYSNDENVDILQAYNSSIADMKAMDFLNTEKNGIDRTIKETITGLKTGKKIPDLIALISDWLKNGSDTLHNKFKSKKEYDDFFKNPQLDFNIEDEIEDIAGGKFECVPVPTYKLKTWKSFLGMYAEEPAG